MFNIKYFQKGFNYCQDGPGNRLVYHLQGCNLKCPWCSNPEGMAIDGINCVTESVNDIFDEIRRSKAMFFDGGGVTFTGGEATLQLEAVFELFQMLVSNGINTAIETNATSRLLCKLFPVVDYMIMDFKHIDNDKFKLVTGGNVDTVLENLKLASNKCQSLAVRIPLIGGFNDDEETIIKMSDFLSTINNERLTLELLPYHEYGKDKWKKLGLEYTVCNAYISKDKLQEITDIFKSKKIRVIRT